MNDGKLIVPLSPEQTRKPASQSNRFWFRLTPECPARAKLLKRALLIGAATVATPVVASLALSTADSDSPVEFTQLQLPGQQAGQKQTDDELSANEISNRKRVTAKRPNTTANHVQWHTETIQRNDTLSTLFERAGAGVSKAYHLAASSKEAKRLANTLKPGKEVAFLFGEAQEEQKDIKPWTKIRFINDKLHYTEIVNSEDGYQINEVTLQPDVIYAFAEATIEYSLFGSANKAGLDDRLTMKLASIFGWDIDFVLDIRQGDSFHIVYEELFLDGEHIGYGEIVAAEFVNQGRSYQAVRYTDSNDESNYFTPSGESMRKAFLRTPVDFARISSHFNLKRKHPILHTIRAHKGTDYAAGRGTPIRATGAGRIDFKGSKGGYGRTIIIQHGQSYKTLYAHMNSYARGIKKGSKVKQGQIIGYVGSSGLATGPHLHYEFHVHGVHRNPVTVEFPKTASIDASEKPRFLAQTSKHLLQLASYLGRPATIHLADAN